MGFICQESHASKLQCHSYMRDKHSVSFFMKVTPLWYVQVLFSVMTSLTLARKAMPILPQLRTAVATPKTAPGSS